MTTLPGMPAPHYTSPDTDAPTGVHDVVVKRDQRFSTATDAMSEADIDVLFRFIGIWRELSTEQWFALIAAARAMKP